MHAMLIDALGYVAAGAVLATFSVRSIMALRVLAIISNLLFIAYAASAMLLPVLALHALLLPLNLMRLFELLGTASDVSDLPEPTAKTRQAGRGQFLGAQKLDRNEKIP